EKMKLPAGIIAIACADLHLDQHAWADRHKICGDSLWAFRWIVDLAIENSLPIIAAGDLLDKQLNNSSVIGFLKEQIDRLNGDGKDGVSALRMFYHIQGQHDMQTIPWATQMGAELGWLASYKQSLNDDMILPWEPSIPAGPEKGKYRLQGIDWTPANKIQEILDMLPETTDVL